MSQMSQASAKGADSGKINQLFDKISNIICLPNLLLTVDSANNIEIEERSIKNIAQKVQLNLLSPQDLAVNSSAQVGYLL